AYADQVIQLLDYLEQEVPLNKDTWQFIPNVRAWVAEAQGRLDDCERFLMVCIERSAESHWRIKEACFTLCRLNDRHKKFNAALEFAKLGEQASLKSNPPADAVIYVAWQALFQRRLENEVEAQQLYKLAKTNIQRFPMPNPTYFQVLSEFHE